MMMITAMVNAVGRWLPCYWNSRAGEHQRTSYWTTYQPG